MLPTYVAPSNLIEFAGGADSLHAKAKHVRPGSERWQSFMIAEIRSESGKAVEQWLYDQLSAHIELLQMMQGPQPVDPAAASRWDDLFVDELFKFFELHANNMFAEDETRTHDLENWLSRNCRDPLQLLTDLDFRRKVTNQFALETTLAIMNMRDKPGQLLSMLGIVTDASGWPDPAPDAEGAPDVPKPRKPHVRRGPKSVPLDAVNIDAKFIARLRDEKIMLPRDLGILLGLTYTAVANVLAGHNAKGLMLTQDEAEALTNNLLVREQAMAEVREKLEQAAFMAKLNAADAGSTAGTAAVQQ